MSNLSWLTRAQMEPLKPFFPKSHGCPRVDDRRVLRGIIFISRNCLRWCDAPGTARRRPLYNRWKLWSDNGVFAAPCVNGRFPCVSAAPMLRCRQWAYRPTPSPDRQATYRLWLTAYLLDERNAAE